MEGLLADTYATNFDAIAVPDFVAGFIYGMTGNNHLEELEACYTGGTDAISDAQVAIADIKGSHFIKGYKDLSHLVDELKAEMTTCQNMDEDVAAIEEWATIFTDPKRLAETVSKNWLLHHRTIKEDIDKEQADWASGAYFDAGVDTALIMTEAVGKIEPAYPDNGIFDQLPKEFIEGTLKAFVKQIIYMNHLYDIEQCVEGFGKFSDDYHDAIMSLLRGDMEGVFENIVKGTPNAIKTILDCKASPEQVKALAGWFLTKFSSIDTIIQETTKGQVAHADEIMPFASACVSEVYGYPPYDQRDSDRFGTNIGTVFYWALGPVESTHANAIEDFEAEANQESPWPGLDFDHIDDFVQAFLEETMYLNHLDHLYKCTVFGSDAYQSYVDAWSSLKKFKLEDTIKEVIHATPELAKAILACPQSKSEAKALANWKLTKFSSERGLIDITTEGQLAHAHEMAPHVSEAVSRVFGYPPFETADMTALGRTVAKVSYYALGPVETDDPHALLQ